MKESFGFKFGITDKSRLTKKSIDPKYSIIFSTEIDYCQIVHGYREK